MPADTSCDQLINNVHDVLQASLDAGENRPVIALSGGSTPLKYMPGIAHLPLDWSRIDWMLADERCVERDHPDSNEALNRGLISDAPMAQAGFVDLRAHIDATSPPGGSPLDLVLLGMGDDGHVASLFPQAESLQDDRHFAIRTALPEPPNPQYERMTLTVPSLLAARHVFLVFAGASKAALWQQVIAGADPQDLPAAFLRTHPGLQVFDLT